MNEIPPTHRPYSQFVFSRVWAMSVLVSLIAAAQGFAEPPPSPREAADALRKASTYLREKVSMRGGYLWTYAPDLSWQRGEVDATPKQVWVQPPGTPAVGMAFLHDYACTGDDYYLDAAVDAARALAWGQLVSGGWGYKIDFHPSAADKYAYRRDLDAGQTDFAGRFNTTTFDDDTTQAAVRHLVLTDQATRFKDEEIHRAALYGLDAILKFQYPNGAWPQRIDAPYRPEDYPVLKARYPESWSRTFPAVDYQAYYTLNDNVIRDCVITLLLAHEVYGDERYLAAARKAGDFLILAQMPEPQPAWAQQYGADMSPAWARKFEPPSIVSGESVGTLKALMLVHAATGDEKYLEPIPRALAYLEKSRLPDGRHARFYELKTNTPLYFDLKYHMTYDDSEMPMYYAFKTQLNLGVIRE